MAYQPQASGPFLKGLVASNQPLAQPKGSFPRGSNLVMMERGALTPCDGSGIINWFNGAVQTSVGRFMSLFLYEPTGVNPYYLAIKQAIDEQLGAPHLNSATASAGGSLTNGTTYYYVITALDGVGGETIASNEKSAMASGGNLSVTLVWDTVPNAFAYNVYRSTSPGTEVLLIGTMVPVIQTYPLAAKTVTFIDNGSAITSETLNNVSAIGYTTARTSLHSFHADCARNIPIELSRWDSNHFLWIHAVHIQWKLDHFQSAVNQFHHREGRSRLWIGNGDIDEFGAKQSRCRIFGHKSRQSARWRWV